MLSHFSRVQLFSALWTVAHQAPLSMEFSWQEYWRGLPCPTPEDLPDPGIELASYVSYIGRQILYHQRHLGSSFYNLRGYQLWLSLFRQFCCFHLSSLKRQLSAQQASWSQISFLPSLMAAERPTSCWRRMESSPGSWAWKCGLRTRSASSSQGSKLSVAMSTTFY